MTIFVSFQRLTGSEEMADIPRCILKNPKHGMSQRHQALSMGTCQRGAAEESAWMDLLTWKTVQMS